jgi:uncharacterized protein HemX
MAKKVSTSGSSKAGLGLAALAAAGAAAAAGYYFYASENAPKNRKIAAKWAGDMKRDVVKEAKKLQKIDKAAVMKIVNQAQAAYAKNGPKIDKEALLKAASELKKHWDEIRDEAAPVVKSAKKAVKKAVKKVAKKTK